MTISDILRHKQTIGGAATVTILASATVAELAATLAEHRIGAVVVLDERADTAVAGIVSERDIVRHLAADGAGALQTTVAQIMTTAVVTCGVHDSVEEVAATMTQRRIRHMPVLDADGLVGIVSIGDVVSSRIRQLEHDRVQLEQYIAG